MRKRKARSESGVGKPGGCQSAVGLLPSEMWGFLVVASCAFKPTSGSGPGELAHVWVSARLVVYIPSLQRMQGGEAPCFRNY